MRTIRWSAVCLVVVATGAVTACNPAHQARQVKNNVDSGNTAACVTERSTIEKAVEAYTLLNPDTAVTEDAMVAAGLIHQASVLMDVSEIGAVVPAPGSVCA
jgi:hypothetical protein